MLVHLSGNEASKMTGDRMARLGKHLIQQRSVYPMFPYAEGAQVCEKKVMFYIQAINRIKAVML